MMTSFMAMVSIDAARQDTGRYDVACCVVKPADKTEPKATSNLFAKAYSTLYRPFISNKLGHVFVCVVTLALFVTACTFLNGMPVGLDLDDFFPIGTQVCVSFPPSGHHAYSSYLRLLLRRMMMTPSLPSLQSSAWLTFRFGR
jgi:hypothetical protein